MCIHKWYKTTIISLASSLTTKEQAASDDGERKVFCGWCGLVGKSGGERSLAVVVVVVVVVVGVAGLFVAGGPAGLATNAVGLIVSLGKELSVVAVEQKG